MMDRGDPEAPTIPSPPKHEIGDSERIEPVALSTATLDQGFDERYQVTGSLGRGGMGEVLLCLDARSGRRVALKRIRGEKAASGSDARPRFVREARVQAQLEHPSIVPVYDLGRTPDGAEFFTMKRVRGETVAQLLAQRKNQQEVKASHSTRQLLTAFSRICLAVDYAHQRGVVHRDLKPTNLMLGDFGEVYVLDWGIAKLQHEIEIETGSDPEPIALPDDDPLDPTEIGAILGTPGYLAPEVIRGQPATPRADVYALGAILFEILTLEPLHDGRSVSARVGQTLAGAHAPPSRAQRLEIPPELEQLVIRATAREPHERPMTARELSDAVERFLDGDRDLRLRAEHAARHVAIARDAAEEALGEGGAALAARQRALREVGRALVFQPDHPEAAATLLRLLTTPPRQFPAEVVAEVRRLEQVELRASARIGSLYYAAALVFVPLILAMGVKSWPITIWVVAVLAVTAGVNVLLSRLAVTDDLRTTLAMISVTLGFASTSALFGPFLLVPAMMGVTTLAFALQPSPRWYVCAIIGSAGIALPAGLEWLGIIPPSYQIAGGILHMLPRALVFHRGTELLLLILSLAPVVMAAGYALNFRRSVSSLRHQVQLQLWQLRQLAASPDPVRRDSAP